MTTTFELTDAEKRERDAAITDALCAIREHYQAIIHDERVSVDARAGYLAVCCAVDYRIPGILNAKPFDDLLPILARAITEWVKAGK